MGKDIRKLMDQDVYGGPVFNPAAERTKQQILTASGAITDAVEHVILNHASVAIAATLAKPRAGRFLVISQADSGTAGHTVTLAAGTFDGTNEIATLNAANECLVLYGISDSRFVVVENIGSVALSTAG